jgi:hypothetical protein
LFFFAISVPVCFGLFHDHRICRGRLRTLAGNFQRAFVTTTQLSLPSLNDSASVRLQWRAASLEWNLESVTALDAPVYRETKPQCMRDRIFSL